MSKKENFIETHPQISGREIFWSVQKIADILEIETNNRDEGEIYGEIVSGRALEGKTLDQLVKAKNALQGNEILPEFGKEYRQAMLVLQTWMHAVEDVEKRISGSQK